MPNLVLYFVVGAVQLVWLAAEWKKRGFWAALQLMLFGVLSAVVFAVAPD